MTKRPWHSAAFNLVLAAVYFGAAKFGLSLAVVNPSASPIWPPTGIALAALLLWGYDLWPAIFLGAFLANLTTQGTFLTSVGIATGNTLEALIGSWLVIQFANGSRAFEQARDIFKFIILAVIVSTACSASIGTTSLALGGFAQWEDYSTVWMTWWLGNAIGAMIVTPLILFCSHLRFSKWKLVDWLELGAIWTCVLLVALIAFNNPLSQSLNRFPRFLLYPAALWAAYRFGQHGAVSAVFLVSSVAIWGTVHGYGPFVDSSGDTNESFLVLQAYLGTFGVTNLILGAVVSELHTANDVLRVNENRFRTLAKHAPVGIFMSDPDGESLYVNESWCAMTGLTQAEAQGGRWIKAVHPEDRERVLAGWKAAVAQKDASAAEFRFVRPDGAVAWVSGRAIQLWNGNGQFLGYIGTVVDITERKLAMEVLERRVRERTMEYELANATLKGEMVKHRQAALARDQLATIVEDSSDAILSKTLDGIITSWNQGAEKLLGYTSAEIVGRPVSVLLPAGHHDELKDLLCAMQRDEPIESFEAVRLRKDGHPVHVWLTLSPLKNEVGRITGVSAIMRDLSERKRLEAEILEVSEREQHRIAEDLHDGVGQQLGGISCLSDVLKKNLEEQDSPEAAAASKISHLLTVAMAQTRSLARGLHPVAPEANGLMSALEDLAARISDLFKVPCTFECPRAVLIQDETASTHLYRIAQEAITNAIKHGQARRIEILLTATPDLIMLTVRDNGSGINAVERHRKGLGLRIMNHRASMIDGTLVVQRNSLGGTDVVCTVPSCNGNNTAG